MGVGPNLAFDAVDLSSTALNSSTLIIPVEAFVPEYNCEIAVVEDPQITTEIVGSFSDNSSETVLAFTAHSLSCKTQHNMPIYPDPARYRVPQRMIFGNVEYTGCDAGSDWINSSTDGLSDISLLLTADLRFEQLIAHGLNKSLDDSITGWSGQVASISALFCRPGYTLYDAEVTVDTSLPAGENVLQTRLLREKGETISGLTNGNVSNAFINAFDALILQTLPPLPAISGASQYFLANQFWNMMSLQIGGSSLEPFLDSQTLHQTAEAVFQGIVGQLAHQCYVETRTSHRLGTRLYLQERLQMKPLSTLVIAVAFTLLFVCTVIVFCSRAIRVIPRDPASIATQAAILAANPSTQQDLSNLGHTSDAGLKNKLHKRSYQSYTELDHVPSFKLSRNRLFDMSLALDKALEYWRPFAISWWFITLLTICTCALIVVLQVLQHISERTTGVTRIQMSSTWAHEFSTVFPAAVMISISEAFKAFYGTFVSILPYSMMHSNAVTVARSLMIRSAGRLHVINAVSGIRLKIPSLAFISTAAFLGTFLSTIVAALYQIESYSAPFPMQFTASDLFDFDFRTDDSNDLPNDNGAGLVFGLVEQQNASYPPFVYEELVYPKFSLPSTGEHMAQGAALQLEIPAFRAALRCSFAPMDNTEFGYYSPADGRGRTFWSVVVNTSFILPEQCHWPGEYPLPHEAVINLRNRATASYGSALIDMLWNWITDQRQTDSPCYTVGFMYGFFQYGSTHKSNITLMNCYQDIESIDTTTTFLPSMRIDPNHPPILHEATRKNVASDRLYRLSSIIDWNLEDFWSSAFDDDEGSTGSFVEDNDVPMDPFFQSVILGPDGIPPDELVGVQNRARFFDATQRTYRKYMALLIHTNMRRDLSSNSSSIDPPTYTGISSTPPSVV